MTSTTDGAVHPDDWIPVEHRWIGLDRRTIAPAVAVIITPLVYRWALPAIDDASPTTTPSWPATS